jgi:hypothetical protein
MRYLQQDDIQDYLNTKSRKKIHFIDTVSKKIVISEDKAGANKMFREKYKIYPKRSQIRPASVKEKENYYNIF